MPRVLAEFFPNQCILVRNGCLLGRPMPDENPTFDDFALEAEDLILRLCGRGGGPSNIDRKQLATAIIKKQKDSS